MRKAEKTTERVMHMIQEFSDYSKMYKSLTLEEMQEIHGEMLQEIGSDPTSLELYGDLYEVSLRYAVKRAEWSRMSREEKMDADQGRTMTHDSVITHFNMLARWLRKQGQPANWRDELGDVEKDPALRKRIGDFACYMVFVSALLER